jgi:hypothetical protein
VPVPLHVTHDSRMLIVLKTNNSRNQSGSVGSPAPLAFSFRLRFMELSRCFYRSQIFIHPKRSITNGAFRVSAFS